MDIRIPLAKTANLDEAFDKVQSAISPELMAKFKVDANFKYDKTGKKIVASGKGFDFTMEFKDKEVVGKLDLSFLLKPLKGKVIEILEKEIKRVV